MSLDRIANIVINLQDPPLGRAGFGVPLTAAILTAPQSTSWDTIYGASVDVIEVTPGDYVAQLAALGVTSSEDLRILLDDIFAQVRKPPLVLVGRRATAVAQVNQFDIDGTDDGTFTVTINGTDFDFVASSSTATEIKDGLLAAIAAGSEPVTGGTVDTDSGSVTADEAGVPFTISVASTGTPADIVTSVTTANTGLPEDIGTWRAERDDWYVLLETTRTSGNIEAAGVAIESLPVDKLFVAQTNDPLAQTGASIDDIASVLGATGLNLFRTSVWWSVSDDQFVDGAITGKMLPSDPGSETWANQTLVSVIGIGVNTGLTSETTLANKRYNWHEVFAAANFSMTQGGWQVNGTFTDVMRGRDFLKNDMQVSLVQALRDAPKIPYTNEGAAIAEAVVQAALERAADQGIITRDSIAVQVPNVVDQDPTDVSNRIFNNITWNATLQGAVHTFDVTGSLVAA